MNSLGLALRHSGRVMLASFLVVCLSRLCLADEAVELTFVETRSGKVYAQAGPGIFASIDSQLASPQWIFEDSNLRLFTKPVFAPEALFVAATSSVQPRSELIRINISTGRADWRVKFDGLGGNGAPVLCAGEVLVADYWRRTISAFNTQTGKNDWTTEGLPMLFLFPPAVLDKNAFFISADRAEPEDKQQLLSVSCEDGRIGKAFPVQVGGVSRTPVLLYKDSAILSGYERAHGTSLKAVNRNDGTPLWSVQIPDEIMRFSPTIRDNFLIASGSSLWVVNLDTGKTLFRETLPIASVPVAAADGLVFLTRGTHSIEARDLPSGKLRWRTRLKERIGSNVAVDDKRIYVKTGTGQVTVLTMAGDVERNLRISKLAVQTGRQ